MIEQENIVKRVCREYGLTYDQLGQEVGFSKSAINNAMVRNDISRQLEQSILLFLRVKELEKKQESINSFKESLKGFLKD